MQLTILCSSADHPINPWLDAWIAKNKEHHQIELVRKTSELSGGDLLLLISCSEILAEADRASYRKSLVIHASDLPGGRGWSPHIWQILEGQESLVVTLLEAADEVDSGDIWYQVTIDIPNTALHDDINELLFAAELELMNVAISQFETIEPRKQSTDIEPTHYRKRTPGDSQLDPGKSIKEQFDLLRVCDPDRYPAFFEYRGTKYKITLEKMDD